MVRFNAFHNILWFACIGIAWNRIDHTTDFHFRIDAACQLYCQCACNHLMMCCLKHDLFLMLPFFKFKTCRIPWNNTAEIDFIKRDPVFYFSFIAFKQCFRILYIKINQNTISPSAICLYQMQWYSSCEMVISGSIPFFRSSSITLS